jgi:hypothetical protein
MASQETSQSASRGPPGAFSKRVHLLISLGPTNDTKTISETGPTNPQKVNKKPQKLRTLEQFWAPKWDPKLTKSAGLGYGDVKTRCPDSFPEASSIAPDGPEKLKIAPSCPKQKSRIVHRLGNFGPRWSKIALGLVQQGSKIAILLILCLFISSFLFLFLCSNGAIQAFYISRWAGSTFNS